MNKLTPYATRLCGIGFSVIAAMTVLLGLSLLLKWQPVSSVNAQTVTIGLITDIGGVNDKAFNQLSYQGLLRAQSELGIVGKVYSSTTPADYGPNLQQCVTDGSSLCITVGFLMANDTLNAATTYTRTKFATVDYDYSSNGYPSNLQGMIFAEKEAGYLAGVLAGKMTHSNVVGVVGGIAVPPVVRYAEGYRNGARCANLTVTVILSYTNSFVDPALGAQVAQSMLAQRADVIFGAGGNTGNGAVLTATQSGAWGIGVDIDQYYTLFLSGTVSGSNKLLTSAMKKVDGAVFSVIADVVSNTFTSGTVTYTVAKNGVGLAPFHEADPSVPQAVRNELESVEQGIANKTIDVNGPCPSKVYLPFIKK